MKDCIDSHADNLYTSNLDLYISDLHLYTVARQSPRTWKMGPPEPTSLPSRLLYSLSVLESTR